MSRTKRQGYTGTRYEKKVTQYGSDMPLSKMSTNDDFLSKDL